MKRVLAIAALAAVAAIHLLSAPLTIWEYDENLYAMGVERFEPLAHHPPPPGSPLFIGFGKLIPTDPFHALVFTGLIAVIAGLIVFARAFGEISGDRTAGVVAAILLYSSPALLISGPLPQGDAGALALLGIAIWMCTRGNPFAMGIACAAAIGWRLQFCVAVVPMFIVALWMLRTWRARVQAVVAFGVSCLAWFVPLVFATGGPVPYWRWLTGQAAYYAQHDSDLSRSGYTAAQLFFRFVAHPWGPKWLALPILLFALIAPAFLPEPDRKQKPVARWRVFLPLIAGTVVYFAFAVATMDPADAVRYSIPALPLIALGAAITLRRAPWLSLAYAAGAVFYVYPILHARATTPSPSFAAARWIHQHVPKSTIVVYDAPLRPHAEFLLRGWKTSKMDDVDPSLPIALYADRERGEGPGVTFRWPDVDAYRKLTRQHYGAVSVIPIPPDERYRVVSGIYAPEGLRDGTQWRWISARGIIELPNLGRKLVRLRLRTPPEYPLERNSILVNGTRVELRRNESVNVAIPFAGTVTFAPERTFVPAEIPAANNRDSRRLSVMLVRVAQE